MYTDTSCGLNSDQTIRVFVSSTFQDMHAERDALNRLVFPELRRRCQERGAEFVGIDMRWGVTEDEIQRDGILAICLDEIARCPFFVCLLGERFGSVYPPDEVPVELWEAAPRELAWRSLIEQWYRRDDIAKPPVYRLRGEDGLRPSEAETMALVQGWEALGLAGAGDSFTAHEIIQGVLESTAPPEHALCYLRAGSLTAETAFPQVFLPLFVETAAAHKQKLAGLKDRVRSAGDRLTVRDYEAQYSGLKIDAAFVPANLSPADRRALEDGVVTPEEWPTISPILEAALQKYGTVALAGIDVLAARVIEDLWVAIEPHLARPLSLDAHGREREYHERFVRQHTASFQGRQQELKDVLKYLASADDRKILVVTGEAGAGKSAFLAACVREARAHHPEALVVPHFIGAAPGSASLQSTLVSICETLRREAGLDARMAEDPDHRRMQLRAFLELAGPQRPIILVVDALDQLDPSDRSHQLDWLPQWVPRGAHIVVSAVTGDCLDQLTGRVPTDHVVTLERLPHDDRRALISSVLTRRRKQLTLDQLNALLDSRTRVDGALPLYTLVALEELCVFGEYRRLEARLASLPPTLPELFAQLLARLEHDHTRTLVETVCSWLAVARSGLLETEVLDLLAANGQFRRLQWTRLYRALEPHLKPIQEDTADGTTGRLDFYHDQLRLAVIRRYLKMTTSDAAPSDLCSAAHGRLAEYFRSVAYDETLPTKWRAERVRSLSELPFHQEHAELQEELEATLCDLGFIEAKCTVGLVDDLLADYSRVNKRGKFGSLTLFPFPDTGPTADTGHLVQEYRALVLHNRHTLRQLPELVFQLAANSEETSAPHQAAVNIERGWSRPWFRVINKSPLHSLPPPIVLSHKPAHDTLRVSFSPTGHRVLSSDYSGRVSVWNIDEGALNWERMDDVAPGASCFSNDGQRVISVHSPLVAPSRFDELNVNILDARTGRVLCAAELQGRIQNTARVTRQWLMSCVHSPTSAVCAFNVGNQIFLADSIEGHVIAALVGHKLDVKDVAFSPCGHFLASTDCRYLRLWNVDTGSFITESDDLFDLTYAGMCCVFSGPDQLLVGTRSGVQLWDVSAGNGGRRFHLVGFSECDLQVDSLAPTHGGQIVCGTISGDLLTVPFPAISELWSTYQSADDATRTFQHAMSAMLKRENSRPVKWQRIGTQRSAVITCAVSQDRRFVAAAGRGVPTTVWDLAAFLAIDRGTQMAPITCFEVAPVGHWVVSGHLNGEVRLWDSVTGEPKPLAVLNQRIQCVGIGPDGEDVVLLAGGAIYLFSRTTGNKQWSRYLGFAPGASAPESEDEDSRCEMSNDRARIVVMYDQRLSVLNAVDGSSIGSVGMDYLQEMVQEDPVLSFAITPNGRHVAALTRRNITVLALQSGAVVSCVRRRVAKWRGVPKRRTTQFSADGANLLVCESLYGRRDLSTLSWLESKRMSCERWLHRGSQRDTWSSLGPQFERWRVASDGNLAYDLVLRDFVSSGAEHRLETNDCAVSPDGRLFCGFHAGFGRITDSLTQEVIAELTFDANATNPKFSPDGEMISCCVGDVLNVCSSRNGMRIFAFRAKEELIDAKWAPDGTRVVCADRSGQLSCLEPRNIVSGPPIVREMTSVRQTSSEFRCPFCGIQNGMPEGWVGDRYACVDCGRIAFVIKERIVSSGAQSTSKQQPTQTGTPRQGTRQGRRPVEAFECVPRPLSFWTFQLISAGIGALALASLAGGIALRHLHPYISALSVLLAAPVAYLALTVKATIPSRKLTRYRLGALLIAGLAGWGSVLAALFGVRGGWLVILSWPTGILCGLIWLSTLAYHVFIRMPINCLDCGKETSVRPSTAPKCGNCGSRDVKAVYWW